MGKAACCTGEGIRKGSWTAEEDQMLKAYIEAHGEGNWRSLPGKAGLQRCGKSCRLRWTNYVRPGIKRGSFTTEEDQTIIKLHAELGNRWAAIARQLPNRTDNEIKNYWNAHLKKRLTGMGIDPETHSPAADATEEGEAIAEMEPEAQTSEQPERPLRRKPALSASAQLLNRLATRLTSLPNLEAIKSHLPALWDMPQRCDSDSSASEDNYNSLWLVDSLADAQEATFESEIESDGNASCKSSGAQSDEAGKEGTQMKSEALNHVASRLGSLSCATEDLTREVVPEPDWGLGRHVAEFPEISVMSDIDVGGLFCDIGSPFPDSRFLEDLSAASP